MVSVRRELLTSDHARRAVTAAVVTTHCPRMNYVLLVASTVAGRYATARGEKRET